MLKEEHELQTGELRRFVKSRLASFKVPQSFRVIDALPKLGSGKVDRSLLAARE